MIILSKQQQQQAAVITIVPIHQQHVPTRKATGNWVKKISSIVNFVSSTWTCFGMIIIYNVYLRGVYDPSSPFSAVATLRTLIISQFYSLFTQFSIRHNECAIFSRICVECWTFSFQRILYIIYHPHLWTFKKKLPQFNDSRIEREIFDSIR